MVEVYSNRVEISNPGEPVAPESLRDRFHLPESKSAIVSQIIASTIDVRLIKPDEKVGSSRKFARYLPFWA